MNMRVQLESALMAFQLRRRAHRPAPARGKPRS